MFVGVEKGDPLREKSFELAIKITRLCQYLVKEHKEYVLSNQLLKAGTNPGAMVREASMAESGHDFVHKLAIAQKEINETMYWLDLLHASDYLNSEGHKNLTYLALEVAKILTASIKTKKAKLNAKN
jgi:four helix bundle protein